MNACGKSDDSIVPMNSANNDATEASAESAEERESARRNTRQSNLVRTQKPEGRRSRGLLGVREAAKDDRQLKFTNLLHHINVALLTASFYQLKKTAAVGIDGVSWHDYELDLENRIRDLHGRIQATCLRRLHCDSLCG